ncbi:MAG: 2-oxo acid dehydrogenase subunit E2 [Cyclobacteriaceae bacterium]|nr:2-oxo acid dehydrogenase subunit E2 [Cyclobacteriaceae bacterium]
MGRVEMVMPKMGESIMEGTILTWLKKVGDPIEQDESVLEVATDKVDTEVPSTHAGILQEILAQEGEVVEVGKPIAIIETSNGAPDNGREAQESVNEPLESAVEVAQPEVVAAPIDTPAVSTVTTEAPSDGRFYSPLVKNIAKKEQIPVEELNTIPGTGKAGRVTKKDILAYLELKGKPTDSSSVTESVAAPMAISGEDEIIEMDRMRKMIATRMVESKRISPHVTSFVEADVTALVSWRNRYKTSFKEREGDNLTFTPLFIEAVVKAINDYPMINISVDGDKIIRKKDINIGMAVALTNGNLIVPVIKNTDRLSLVGLTKKVNDLAKRARNNQLKPDDLSGGTYTISNVGSFGNVMGTPIIMQPQVGILALGAITKKPAVVETSYGDAIAIRHKMFLSHSYDHRVVDGSLGGMFVRRVADYLERFDTSRTI